MSCSSEQKSGSNKIIVDPNIKNEVEKYIVDKPEYAPLAKDMEIYNNSLHVESFENDELRISSTDFSKKIPFKSFYFWNEETLKITGAFGLFGGTGFYIAIEGDKATLFHLLAADNSASLAYKEDDEFIFKLEVPCTDTKLVLSEIPDPEKKQVIYGYVEFKSNEFYSKSNASVEGEKSKRKKMRNNMKIYFRSSFFKFE